MFSDQANEPPVHGAHGGEEGGVREEGETAYRYIDDAMRHRRCCGQMKRARRNRGRRRREKRDFPLIARGEEWNGRRRVATEGRGGEGGGGRDAAECGQVYWVTGSMRKLRERRCVARTHARRCRQGLRLSASPLLPLDVNQPPPKVFPTPPTGPSIFIPHVK